MSGTPLLILSIFSLFCCQILSPVVFFLANSALTSGTVPPQDIGTTNAAKIIGIIGTVLLVLGILFRLLGFGNRMRRAEGPLMKQPVAALVVQR